MKQLLILISLIFNFSITILSQSILNQENKTPIEINVQINLIDEKTEKVITGAKVYIPNHPGYSDQTDNFGQANLIINYEHPEYLVFVDADGYHEYYNTIILNELKPIQSFTFKLNPIVDFFDLRVKIIDNQTNEYIEDATAELIGKNTIPPQRDGSIVLFKNVPINKSHIVKIEHSQYKTSYFPSPDNIENEKEITINAPMERDHFPVEIIVRSSGAPLRNAAVNFLGFKGNEFKAKTNNNGIAYFPSIEKGFKQIEISKSNFYPKKMPITIAKKIAPEINQFSYSLEKEKAPDSLTLEGRIVIEGTNTGLKDAAIRIKSNHGIHSYFTNENGEFQMTKKIAYDEFSDFSFFLTVEHKFYKTFYTKELHITHQEFLRNRKIVSIVAPHEFKIVNDVYLKLSKPIFDKKYVKDCEYKVKGKWEFGYFDLKNEGETEYLILKAPLFWEEVAIKICTPEKMYGDKISRKDIEKKGNKNYKIKLYKNKKGKQCDPKE